MANYSTKSLIDTVIKKSKDPSFDRSLILDYLQDTQNAVLNNKKFKFTESDVEEDLIVGSWYYQYDYDHQQIIKLVLLDYSTDPVTIYTPHYMPSEQFFDIYVSPEDGKITIPMNYTDYNNQIVFQGPLIRNYTLKMKYVSAPYQLEDTDDSLPQIPISFKDIYIQGGLAGVEEYRENYDIAGVHKRTIEDLADDMMARYGTRRSGPGKSTTRGKTTGYYTYGTQ